MKRLLIGISLVLVVAIVGMGASYQQGQKSLLDIDDNVRASFPGDFAELDDGVISYYDRGPKFGDVVVLVHGLSTPKSVFSNNVDHLVNAGFRVIAYDHYGRGYSDRPEIAYDTDLYTRELQNLLDVLSVNDPVTLVGNSMGAANVISFAAKFPSRVKKLILIAPAGLEPKPPLLPLVTLPGLGEWLAGRSFGSPNPGYGEPLTSSSAVVFADNYMQQFLYKGYAASILSTLRNGVVHERWDDYGAVGRLGIPVFALWGTADTTSPFSGSEKLRELISAVELLPIADAGHSIVYSKAATVNRMLLDILSR